MMKFRGEGGGAFVGGKGGDDEASPSKEEWG
jgi:hypothetical protein